MSRKNPEWNSKYHIKTSQKRSYLDLNVLLISNWFSSEKGRVPPFGAYTEYFDKNVSGYTDKRISLVDSIKGWIEGYAVSGRITLVRSVYSFLYFQYLNDHRIGTDDGLNDYAVELAVGILHKVRSSATASGNFSAVNKFLIYTGCRETSFKYEFSNSYEKQKQQWSIPYSQDEFREMYKLTFSINEKCKEIIDKHIDTFSRASGFYGIDDLVVPMEYKTYVGDHYLSALIRNVQKCYMSSSYYIFMYFTWGNVSSLDSLSVDQLVVDASGGLETKFIYKGRARKYIRLNIGLSEVDAEKTGSRWFEGFFKTRSLLKNYLIESESAKFVGDPLFFSRDSKDKTYGRLSDQARYTTHRTGFHDAAKVVGVTLPTLESRKIRKTCIQIADRTLRNPLATSSKAQHEWETYRDSYAQGNPVEARDNMSKAFGVIEAMSMSGVGYRDRKRLASQHGVKLVKSRSTINPMLNGFGCRHNHELNASGGPSGSKDAPSICVDFLNCSSCENCIVIEGEESVYKALSFRESILYKKPCYMKSEKARKRYEDIVAGIDSKLKFVSEGVFEKATLKLEDEGVSEVWSL